MIGLMMGLMLATQPLEGPMSILARQRVVREDNERRALVLELYAKSNPVGVCGVLDHDSERQLCYRAAARQAQDAADVVLETVNKGGR